MDQALNEFGLSHRDMNEIFRILQTCPEITRVHIFGSRAKGTFHNGSDIDLAIMNDGIDLGSVQMLSALFRESSLPYAVDLVDYAQLKHSEFREHIERVGKLFYYRL
jgi:predicted nucleotidyltransferase